MPASSTTFSQRLDRIEQGNGATGKRKRVRVERDRTSIDTLHGLVVTPMGLFLGAFAIIASGVLQIAVLGGGLAADTVLPPQLGFIGVACGILLCVTFDSFLGLGKVGKFSLVVGFICAFYCEPLLFEAYPETWFKIYDAQYLPVSIRPDSYLASLPGGVETAVAGLGLP